MQGHFLRITYLMYFLVLPIQLYVKRRKRNSQ